MSYCLSKLYEFEKNFPNFTSHYEDDRLVIMDSNGDKLIEWGGRKTSILAFGKRQMVDSHSVENLEKMIKVILEKEVVQR